VASTDLVPASDYQSLAPQTLDLVREAIGTGQLREFDLKRVSMATGGNTFWNVPTLDGEEAVKELQGVILHSKESRTYWQKAYDGSNDPPDCSSRNAVVATPRQVDNDDPDAPAEFFQPPAQQVGESGMTPLYHCATCQFSQWGSKIRDGKQTRGQACKLSRQLFLLAPVTRLPLVVNLPPTSLRAVTDYLYNLLDYGVDYKSIITRITLEKVTGKGVPDYAVAKFSTGERLSEEQFALAVDYSDMLAPAFEQVTPDRVDVDDVAAA
jgi:hypothetical protein